MKRIFLLLLTLAALSVVSFAQSSTRDGETKNSKSTDSPVKILYKPRAEYPKPDNGTICVTGTVTLKVEFLDSGKIGEIAVVNGLPYGLTENAIAAARKIKFQPAKKDGKFVTRRMIVLYSFSL